MSASRRLVVVATALGTVAAGLLSGATVTTADATSRASAARAQAVEVFIRRDHTVVMPTEIRPGVTTFTISSRRSAGFQILQAADGYTKREFARDANASFSGEGSLPAFRRFEAGVTLLGGVPSTRTKRATMSVDLPPGTYWALDTMPRLIRAEKILTFTVAGEDAGGRLSGQVIRATGEHSWGKVTPRIRTNGRIWFQNPSDANHFIEIVKLARGKTMKDFRSWINRVRRGDEETPPPVSFRAPSIDTGVISGGTSMSFKYRLPAGRYVLLCWWPDADMGGEAHALLGMYRGLKVG